MVKVEQPLGIISVFIWVGMIIAISFMEAWLKFRAPGVTLPIGLGIGRLVFGALNRVEWILAVVVTAGMLFGKKNIVRQSLICIVLIVLALQTFWLLPALDRRAEIYISGQTPGPSSLHIYFVAAESLKLICLTITGIFFLEKNKNYGK